MANAYPEKLKGEEPAWLVLAKAEIGQREYVGSKDNPRIMGYYRDADHPEVEHDEEPWCAAFVGAMLNRSGNAFTHQLNARSYATFGKPCGKKVGAIVVMWRESPRSWKGHVGILVDWRPGEVLILGGNQGDAVSLVWTPETRVLEDGYRWPSLPENSQTEKWAKIGTAATATAATSKTVREAAPDVLPSVLPAGDPASADPWNYLQMAKAAAKVMPIMEAFLAVLAVAAFVYIVWRRRDDRANKGT